MHIKSIKDVPLFPVIPILPTALVVGSLFVSIRALMRVKRLEKRLAALAG
jgi:hypothetical protein